MEEVSVSETNQGKTPPVEEKNLEQVEQEVIVSEPKHQKTPPTTSEESKLKKVKQEVSVGEAEAKTTHIEKTTQDQEKKTLATDEAKKDIKGRESRVMTVSKYIGVFIILKLNMTNLFASQL